MIKRKLLSIAFTLASLTVAAHSVLANRIEIARGAGPLEVTFPTTPLFSVTGLLPSESANSFFKVKNTTASPVSVAVRAKDIITTPIVPSIANELDITITAAPGATIYGSGSPTGSRTLSDFYTAPQIDLPTLSPGEEITFTISLQLHPLAGNEYQEATTQFDLVVGIGMLPPAACQNLNINGKTYIGTPGPDNFQGTSKNDLFFALEGDDRVSGGGGDDCMVGGAGQDRLIGGSGNDYILGEEGSDDLRGGTGEDFISGGPGDDNIDASSGYDIIFGDSGHDYINAGSGSDTVSGGEGNDTIEAGSGADSVSGGTGDDSLDGGTGNDSLHGNDGADTANGRTGTDTCTAETLLLCEI